MTTLAAFLAGLVFGLGLLVAGMADPAKVLAFLDVFGRWDPSLMLVMGGAIAVAMPAFAWSKRRRAPVLDAAFHLPTSRRIDRPLVIGSLLFGIGWGLVGLCPGPALVLLGSGQLKAALFVTAMVAGMALYEWWSASRAN
ncbi:YeeE/YedE family protein [Roseateles amylovorans]|uniref:YeeE/YedE family protein n=1 Tax=Roseateles amylovorans TaxID=2978473 RepID=A0ABY6AYP1_9BURK|nr:YeeE/YedE family protein [Roseateles amylovorans]UXH77398.1 YeeE/YedE family protein [Roseateles amylovorans]